MRTRTKQLIIALLLAQGVAFGTYRLVERSRAGAAAPFAVDRLSGTEAAPDLELERRDGSPASVRGRGRPLLVHFWATWCAPCREELPGLLALAARESGRVELVAISVDESWEVVTRFFDGAVPAAVLRARRPDAHTRYGARALPDTYLVDAAGRLVERFAGARDWRSPAASRHVAAALARLE